MEKSKAIPEKPSPFCDSVLGEWLPDKKMTNKDALVFTRKGECNIPENYCQDWIDPITFKRKKIHGKVSLVEHKIVSKKNGDVGYSRSMEPALKGSFIIDVT